MGSQSITDSMEMSLSKLWEIVKDREDWRAAGHGVTKSKTRLSDWTTTRTWSVSCPAGDLQVGPYTPIAAWLQILPEGLHLGQVHLVEGDGHLPDEVVAAEAFIVQDLEVEDPLHHFLVGETWGADSAGKQQDRAVTRSPGRAALPGRNVCTQTSLKCQQGPSHLSPSTVLRGGRHRVYFTDEETEAQMA